MSSLTLYGFTTTGLPEKVAEVSPEEVTAEAAAIMSEATVGPIVSPPWASEQDRLQCEMDVQLFGVEITETVDGKLRRLDPQQVLVWSPDNKHFTVKM